MTAPQYEALLHLQQVDTAIDQARHRRRALPARAELSQIEATRAAVAARRAPVEEARDEVLAREGHLEAELAHTEERSREVTARLYGGTVSASRDLQALAAEIETLGSRASGLEDQVLAVLDEREPLDAAVAALDAEDADLDARAAAARADVALGEEEVDAVIAGLEGDRAASAAAVPAELTATYERLRTRLGGIGAARLEGARCGGCHLDLSATELDTIRHLPPDDLVPCEQCGRILVRP